VVLGFAADVRFCGRSLTLSRVSRACRFYNPLLPFFMAMFAENLGNIHAWAKNYNFAGMHG
jgi:hypothetical protein